MSVLSRTFGVVSHADLPRAFTQPSIRLFAKYFAVDTDEAERPLSAYRNLAKFLNRRLKTGARVTDRRPGLAVAPVDGRVVSFGRLGDEAHILVKGTAYSVFDLIGHAAPAATFTGGHWLTIELTPRDAHRVYHPVEGLLTHSSHSPGHSLQLPWRSSRDMNEVSRVGERLVTLVDSPLGTVATIMLGRFAGGRVALLGDDKPNRRWRDKDGMIHFAREQRVARGDELGCTDLGSTVVILFGGAGLCLETFQPNGQVKVGQVVARQTNVRPAVKLL